MSVRTLLYLTFVLVTAGCTVQRMQHDTVGAIEWARFKDGVQISGSTRWRLPPNYSVEVVELAPAEDPAWLPAAIAGVASVFPTAGADGPSPVQLLVNWPSEHQQSESPPERSSWSAANPTNWLPAPSDGLAIGVALVDVANDDLIQAAELRLTPHWFSAQRSRPQQIERAFHILAASLTSG
jgi:hypothetical protein